MIYEDGRLWPDEIQDTYPTQSGGEEITYECECGDKFTTEEEAEQHIEEVQNQ